MAYNNIENWKPNKNTAEILDRALYWIKSVPYKVSARWVFYKLFQEGVYNDKEGYRNFTQLTSRARHAFWNGWRPDILADDTREVIHRSGYFENVGMAINALAGGLTLPLDHWYGQDYYVEIWYEARAMTNQFRHYTQEITLRPFGGQPSIPYKWQAAKEIEKASEKYGKEIVILYFGDLDKAGKTISDTGEEDATKWCEVDFQFIRCGLTEDQVQRYGVPENPEKPGYQWEGLSDEGAREIIERYFDEYVSREIIMDYQAMTADLQNEVKSRMVVMARELEQKYQEEK